MLEVREVHLIIETCHQLNLFSVDSALRHKTRTIKTANDSVKLIATLAGKLLERRRDFSGIPKIHNRTNELYHKFGKFSTD